MVMAQDYDVVVVGAGPVGLAQAIELGSRGVRVMLAERSERAGHAPRAKTTNVRTRTHLRRWGLAEKLAQASPQGVDYPNDVVFTTRLGGYELARFRNAFNGYPNRSELYPEHAQWIPQYVLERVMREHVAVLPSVDLVFDREFVAVEQDADGLGVEFRDGAGGKHEITCRYLVGADGARSAVREVIGARLEGRYGLSRNYNIVFRAPGLAQAHAHGPAVMYWQVNQDGASLIGPMDSGDIWFFMPTGMKEGETLSNAAAADAIRQSTGLELPFEVLSTDEWVASHLLADRYRQDRIFLAGDACHLHPPFGGYGMNMGVGDGVDLGWKIAAVLQGWGGSALLDSYEAERRPVHRAVIDEALANHAVLGGQLFREGLEEDTEDGRALRHDVGAHIQAVKAREFHTLGTVLGLCYGGSPVIVDDGSPPSQSAGAHYAPCARPGCLAPHAWLPDGRSIYDMFGSGFSLLIGKDAARADIGAAEREAEQARIPLTVVQPPGLPVDALYGAPLTLIRPDQHVAWRGARWSPSALRKAVGLTIENQADAVRVEGKPSASVIEATR